MISDNEKSKLSSNLISLGDAFLLDIDRIRSYYKTYVNPGVEDIIYSFAFGEDVVEAAQGCWMYFRDKGNVFDATGGMGVLTLGHNHPRVLDARIRFQQANKMEVHKLLFSPYSAVLAHNLAQLFDNKLRYSFFCNSGAEAVDGAIKTAYKYHDGKRKCILHAEYSYHGKLIGAGSVTGSRDVNFQFQKIAGVHSFVYNSIESVREKVNNLRTITGESDIYAVIIETYSISNLTPCEDGFLMELRELCDENGIILILDEVFCGWYKTGPLFYFMKSGVYPHIVTLSKALGGGKSSISAFVTDPSVFIKAYGSPTHAFLHSNTYNGFGEECATAIETINIMMEENIAAKTKILEERITSALQQLKAKHTDKVTFWGGAGTYFGFQIKVLPDSFGKLIEVLPVGYTSESNFLDKLQAAAFCDYLFREHNIYTIFAGQHDIRIVFAPPAIVTELELEDIIKKIDTAIAGFSFSSVIEFAARKFYKKIA
jgi:putrescine aminotransferase